MNTTIHRTEWDPTTDLNDLKRAFLMLSHEQQGAYFNTAFNECGDIFTDQESHAQAILKAKGVEV